MHSTSNPTPPCAAGRTGWRGSDLATDPARWTLQLNPNDVREIDAALLTARRAGCTLGTLDRARFPLQGLAGRLAGVVRQIREGCGFVLLRGLPVQRWSDDDVGLIFYGMGLYMGQPVAQNPQGDLLGPVHDQGRPYGQIDVRGYETHALLPFHTDGCELLGLLCLRSAKAGGISSISSAVALHDEISRCRPDLLAPLMEGYRYIRREAALTDDPVSPLIPVYGQSDGVVSCRFVPTQIDAAATRLRTAIDGAAREALNELVRLSHDSRFRLDIDLQPGDIQFVNNYTVLHSRTEYEDHPEPERRRHMLRLWLAFDEAWPLPAGFNPQRGYRQGHLAERHLA